MIIDSISMQNSLISLKNVSKTFGEGATLVKALKDVDLVISPGEFIVVLGPSGSGKTTLLNLIGGLDKPTQGQIFVDNLELTTLSAGKLTKYRRYHVGFIFQFFNLIPSLNAEENVALTSSLNRKNALDPKKVLEDVGLADRMELFPVELSGGEQQRVAVARALAKNTPIMLCDEPTGELDYETGKKILSLLRKLNKDTKKTFLVVTHNAAIGDIADRVIALRSGQISSDKRNERPADPENLKW
jgi:putative ABC transport system ATP-binding protein